MHQFFTPDIDLNGKSYSFNEIESKHIAKVLRKKSGDILRLTNGKGALIMGQLELVTPKICNIRVSEITTISPPKNAIHMMVAPTKNISRFEWFLEKATELGVQRITPLLCERSERKHFKHERCEKIVHAALKQSLGVHAPILEPLTPLTSIQLDKQAYIAHCLNTPKHALKEVILGKPSGTILIGPEGDFSENEIAWAIERGAQAVHLGNKRLRTETAAIVALHTALLMND